MSKSGAEFSRGALNLLGSAMHCRHTHTVLEVAMTTIGNCQLCGIKSELQDSHIWPRFIYKATIADQTKGGAFVDIAKGDRSNRQYTLPLFCRACETGRTGPADSEAARIIKLFLERKCEKVTYTVEFLRFAVSISLRTVLFHQITRSASFDKSQRQRIYPAIKRWKEFLLEKTGIPQRK